MMESLSWYEQFRYCFGYLINFNNISLGKTTLPRERYWRSYSGLGVPNLRWCWNQDLNVPKKSSQIIQFLPEDLRGSVCPHNLANLKTRPKQRRRWLWKELLILSKSPTSLGVMIVTMGLSSKTRWRSTSKLNIARQYMVVMFVTWPLSTRTVWRGIRNKCILTLMWSFLVIFVQWPLNTSLTCTLMLKSIIRITMWLVYLIEIISNEIV